MAASYASALFYYLVGGVTFLPLCLLAGFLHFVFLAPRETTAVTVAAAKQLLAEDGSDLSLEAKAAAIDVAVQNAKAHAAHQEAEKSGAADVGQGLKGVPAGARRVGGSAMPPKPHLSGWLVVRRQFASMPPAPTHAAAGTSTSANGETVPASKSTGYMSAMYRGILDYRGNKRQEQQQQQQPQLEVPSDQSRQGAASPTPSSRSPAPPHESYFCILKDPILYLYSSQDLSTAECLAAIDLRGKRVSIWIAREGDVEDDDEESRAARIKDGELFQKRNAVRILANTSSTAPVSATSPRPQWFVFFRSATNFEDWYHALYYASLQPTNGDERVDPIAPIFDLSDMQSLLTSLDSLPDPIPLRWLNAMVGRIFYSIYRTAWLEQYVTRKLMKKISRVRTPSFLSDVRVKDVNLGSTPPAFSRPMLKALTGTGEASMEVAVHYAGAMRLTISTVLTISLGSRFKPYNVPLVLAVVLTSLEGNLLLQVKPPPSNRLWFGFTSLPKMEVDIEPVVSERKVQWSMVKRIIEGRIKELMMESVVVPNMDDMPFYDTRGGKRGGIWASAARREAQEEGQRAQEKREEAAAAAGQKAATQDGAQTEPDRSILAATTALEDRSDAASIRSRKSGGAPSVAESTASTPPLSTAAASSPAMAGLSALLARNNATTASADSASSGSSSAPTGHAKKKSWFAGGSRAPSRKGTQSSLAWGNASVALGPSGERVPSSSNASVKSAMNEALPSATEASETKPDVEVEQRPSSAPADAASEALETAEAPALTPSSAQRLASEHSRNRSTSSLASSATSSVDTETMHAALEKSLELSVPPTDGDDLETPRPDETISGPALSSSAPATAVTADEEQQQHVAPPPDIAVSAHDYADDTVAPQEEPISIPTPASPASIASQPSTLSPVMRSSHGFAPPPRRSSPAPAPSPVSLPSANPAPVSRTFSRDSRLSAGEPPSGGTGRLSAGLSPATQAALSAGWNKAKASMADKESRQAAARDAKDAIKKGWASWNAKRKEHGAGAGAAMTSSQSMAMPPPRRGGETLGEHAGMSSSSSTSSMSTSSSSTWRLGATSTDPVSLGAGFGFEMSPHGSPEWQRSQRKREKTLPESVSAASSDAGRSSDAYRQYRAHRGEETLGAAQQGQQQQPSTSSWESTSSTIPMPAPAAQQRERERSHSGEYRNAEAAKTSATSSSGAGATGPIVALSDVFTTSTTSLSPLPSQATATSATLQGSPASADFVPLPPAAQPLPSPPAAQAPMAAPASPGKSSSSPPPTVAAASSSPPANTTAPRPATRIRSQPGQTTMMAIPGIPSARRTSSGLGMGMTGSTAAATGAGSEAAPASSSSSSGAGTGSDETQKEGTAGEAAGGSDGGKAGE